MAPLNRIVALRTVTMYSGKLPTLLKRFTARISKDCRQLNERDNLNVAPLATCNNLTLDPERNTKGTRNLLHGPMPLLPATSRI
jgi:hypothetical protein